jgi:sporulation protein YlmC with PRC-barrel domain/CBS domain-containing protein
MASSATLALKVPDLPPGLGTYRFLFLSELLKKPVFAGKVTDKIGKLTDMVVHLREPYPEVVGIYIEHGWGKPTEFVPWESVVKIEDDGIFVAPRPGGEPYPPFVDQPGWLMLEQHLFGKTVLDMDGRQVEVVNDVHLLLARGRVLVVHVDTSFNGFLRRWGLGRLRWFSDELISWKFVQPLSVEDAAVTDKVNLSVTRSQLKELPGEDLADALEELTGKEQEALFSALDEEKAAETLVEAEPRAQRQLMGNLKKERAQRILSEMTVPQLASLFSVLPHDDVEGLLSLLPDEEAERVKAILSEREAQAVDLISSDYLAVPPEGTVGDVLSQIRGSGREPGSISYIYTVGEDGQTVQGVIDLRALILAPDETPLSELAVSPVVSAEAENTQEEVAEIFAKYHYRTIPVVDPHDRILGVIRYNDIMSSTAARAKD